MPQKIHMALGSLQDQVTYPQFIPKEERTRELEVQMQEVLDLVGIGYLVKRWEGDADETNYEEHAGWDHIVRWEDVLSLGEQQVCTAFQSSQNGTSSCALFLRSSLTLFVLLAVRRPI